MTGDRFECGACSHAGRVRAANEDAFAARAADGVFVVADGMGGHEHGEWASAAIVAAVREASLPDDFDAARAMLGETLRAANARIWAEARTRGVQMGSTVVVLLVRGRRFAVLWVGDSRAYLSRAGQLVRLSRDHSQVQELVDRGLVLPDEVHRHPLRHVLARAVGVGPEVQVDTIGAETTPSDTFLLCSDGLTARVEDHEIGAVLDRYGPDECASRLVTMTLDRGAPDNVTVVAVRAEQATVPILSRLLQTAAP